MSSIYDSFVSISTMVSEDLLIGVALGAIPSSELARLVVALLAKKFGLKPSEIRKFNSIGDTPDEQDE
jgi:hypothetical protein